MLYPVSNPPSSSPPGPPRKGIDEHPPTPLHHCTPLHRSPLSAQQPRNPRTGPVSQAEVDRITRDAILIDTHNDVTSKTVDGYNIADPNRKGQTDLPRMKGFLGAEFFAIFVDADYVNGNHSANRTLQMIDTVRTDIIAAHPKDFVFATTAQQIVDAHSNGRIAALWASKAGTPSKTPFASSAISTHSASAT